MLQEKSRNYFLKMSYTVTTSLTLGHASRLFEPRHEKTCFCPMWTTKAQISLPMVDTTRAYHACFIEMYYYFNVIYYMSKKLLNWGKVNLWQLRQIHLLTMILTKLSSLVVSVGEATSRTMRSGSYSPSGILSGSTGRGRVPGSVYGPLVHFKASSVDWCKP